MSGSRSVLHEGKTHDDLLLGDPQCRWPARNIDPFTRINQTLAGQIEHHDVPLDHVLNKECPAVLRKHHPL